MGRRGLLKTVRFTFSGRIAELHAVDADVCWQTRQDLAPMIGVTRRKAGILRQTSVKEMSVSTSLADNLSAGDSLDAGRGEGMMCARIFAGFVVVLAGMAWSVCTVAQEQGDAIRKRATWRIALSLDTPNLVPPAVQYAVFDKDPIPGFKASLKRMQSYHQKELQETETEANSRLACSVFLKVHWDLGFKEITGDNVHLLTTAPGVSHSVSSISQDGKKWIVTKVVWIKGEPVCWCLPVETETGEGIEVVFTERNDLDLEAVYDDVMLAPNHGK